MIRRVEDCRKKQLECHRRAFACRDHAIRVMYLDLVYQWRQIADEFEQLERAKLKGTDERTYSYGSADQPTVHIYDRQRGLHAFASDRTERNSTPHRVASTANP
jgi:hypothetical protein